MNTKTEWNEMSADEAYEEYIRIQKQEMLGEDNKYFAYLKLNREPSEDEAAMHYVENDGAKDFGQRHGHLVRIILQNGKK